MTEPVPRNVVGRRCVLGMVVSIDGYANGPGGEFIPPAWSADLDAWAAQCAERFDTLLCGRLAWQGMADYWQAAEADPAAAPATHAMARFMNGARKIVFSRTLSSADAWCNSEIAKGDPAKLIIRPKAEPGKEIGILASVRLAQTALAGGAVDELALLVIPELFGHGTRLFDGHALRRNLHVIETRTMDAGAVQMRYLVQTPRASRAFARMTAEIAPPNKLRARQAAKPLKSNPTGPDFSARMERGKSRRLSRPLRQPLPSARPCATAAPGARRELR